MRRAASQMQRGQSIVSDVETLSEEARQALDQIVEATATAAQPQCITPTILQVLPEHFFIAAVRASVTS